MKIAIIIVSYNSENDLAECLISVSKLITNNLELITIIVDNASSDDSVKVARSFKSVMVIKNKENLGFSGGNNIGIKTALKSGAEFILILNPDTKINPNLVEEFLKVVKSDKELGILAPKIYFWEGFEFHKNRYLKNERGKIIWYAGGIIDWNNVYGSHRGVDEVDKGQYDNEEETDFATGACMFIRRDVFGKIGYFDPKYFLYLEDIDLCVRAKQAGFKIVYVPQAMAWHKWAQSTQGGSDLQDYYITRNRLLFGNKYAPLYSKISLVKQGLSFVFKDDIKRRAVVDFIFGKFGKGQV